MKNRSIVLLDNARLVGRAIAANVGPRQSISVPSSGEGPSDLPGGKCDHGVYIPAMFLSTERAPNCSVCYPYAIAVAEHGLYKI